MQDELGRSRPPLTQMDLDAQGCGTPNCGHDHSVLFLTAMCHPRAGLNVAYHKASGVMEVDCRICRKPVAVIEVAP